MLPEAARQYLMCSIEGAPDVFECLLFNLSGHDVRWDFSPDPDRFTLREIMAHQADFNNVFLNRLERTTKENEPLLPNWDEGQAALRNNYAQSDARESLRRFRHSRKQVVEFLDTLPTDLWSRVAMRDGVGRLTLEEQAVFFAAHDGYHLQQVSEWLQKAQVPFPTA